MKISYGFKSLVNLGVEIFFFKILIGRTFFNFSCKTSRSCLGTCSFGGTFLSFFGHFFLQNFSFLRGWEVFLSKKIHFFLAKIQFLRGWVVFLVPFLSFFCHFLMQNFSFLRGWMVFLSKKRHFFSCKASAFVGLGGLFEYKNDN